MLAARLDAEEWIFVTLDQATTKHQDFLPLWAGEEQHCRSWVNQEMIGQLKACPIPPLDSLPGRFDVSFLLPIYTA